MLHINIKTVSSTSQLQKEPSKSLKDSRAHPAKPESWFKIVNFLLGLAIVAEFQMWVILLRRTLSAASVKPLFVAQKIRLKLA